MGHRLQGALREVLHRQPAPVGQTCPLIQADKGEERPIRRHGGTGELRQEMGADPGVAAEESVSRRQHKWLEVGQVSEEAAAYGRQLDAGFSQQGSNCLQRGRGALARFLLESQLAQLDGLRSSAVSLSGKQTDEEREEQDFRRISLNS